MNRAWLRACLTTAVAGCASVTFSNTRLENFQRELNRRYGLWRDQGISSYSYRFERACPCRDASLTRPVIVTVEQDSVLASVTYADSGTAVPDSNLGSYFTVVGLFVQLQNAISLQADSLEVEYDQVLNYPRKIVVDQDLRQPEDELTLIASELIPKQP